MFLERQHFGMRLPDIFQITTHLLKTTLHDSKGRGFSTELNHKNSTQPLKLKQIVLNFETEMLETPSPACLVLALTDQRQCDFFFLPVTCITERL